MRLTSLLVFFVAVLSAARITAGTEEQESKNLIQREMTALDAALKVAVDAIVLNDLQRIFPAFQEMDSLRAQREETVKGGTRIALPRNQKRFKEFLRLDNKFHHDVDLLLKAARKNNLGAVQRQTHVLLDACVRCHRIFRN